MVDLVLFDVERLDRVNWISHLVRYSRVNNCKELLFTLGTLIEDVDANIYYFDYIVSLDFRTKLLPLDLHKSHIFLLDNL